MQLRLNSFVPSKTAKNKFADQQNAVSFPMSSRKHQIDLVTKQEGVKQPTRCVNYFLEIFQASS